MPGLGALADFQFNHLDLVVGGDLREQFRIEAAVAVAAAEIAGADFPDDVAAVFAVIWTDSALAGVMREAALLGASVQCAHGVRAERTETHRRDVEYRSRIGLAAIRAADADAKLLAVMRLGRHRMVHPFVPLPVDVLLSTERPLVEHHLG